MVRYGIQAPIRGYPFYENRLRVELGQTFRQAQHWSAEMMAEFSEVAARNEAAWDPVVRTASEVETVAGKNRMICFPYTMFMVAQPVVDLAAAVIVTSLQTARQLGVPDDRIVHVWGGAGARDTKDLLARRDYGRSPAMQAALLATLEGAEVGPGDVDVVDLYSCFPVVPKLASLALKLPDGFPLTATGGLNTFGQPANNYSMHAIVAVVRALRQRRSGLGLVYGNGEVVTKHHAVLLGTEAHPHGYMGQADPVWTAGPDDAYTVVESAPGEATIDTYTVEYSRDGRPELGFVVGRTVRGARVPAHVHDRATLESMVRTDMEVIGRVGNIELDGEGLNSFSLSEKRG
jgi:acetyl-CoA C-acetyltransferase